MYAIVRLIYENKNKIVPTKFLYSEDKDKSVYCYISEDFCSDRPPLSELKELYSRHFVACPKIYRVYIKGKFGEWLINF